MYQDIKRILNRQISSKKTRKFELNWYLEIANIISDFQNQKCQCNSLMRTYDISTQRMISIHCIDIIHYNI